MDDDRFDIWIRQLAFRRSVLGMLAGAVAGTFGWGVLPDIVAKTKKKKKRKKKRCRGTGKACASTKRCCRGRECLDGRCCPRENVFVNCPEACLCEDNKLLCCAGTSQSPPTCPLGPDAAPAFCCPPENVCGDVCCSPDSFVCDAARGTCVCILPDILDCPSGGGGFLRVRHRR
jgi:hypothetical protein